MVEVYTRLLRDRYHTHRWLSLGVLFNLACLAALILCPFFIAYQSDGVWLRMKLYSDQPHITFTRELIISGTRARLITGGANNSLINVVERPIHWSSVDSGSDTGSQSWPTSWKHSEIDENYDGTIDRIRGSVTFTLSPTESVQSVDAVFGYHCEIANRVRLSMTGAISVSHASPLPARGMSVTGDLLFHSINPITKIGHRAVYNGTVFQSDSDTANVRRTSWQRNDSIVIDRMNVDWRPLPISPSPLPQSFILDYEFRVPQSVIRYIPDWNEELKNAFIQWLAFAVLIAAILTIIRAYVYEQRWIITNITRDTLALRKQHTL